MKYDNIERFKYRLTEAFSFDLPGDFPEMTYPLLQPHEWIQYNDDLGIISYTDGYCWDGSSGPTIDSKKCQLAGLIHDAGYQFLREGVFGSHGQKEDAREYFDDLYYQLCVEGGMGEYRAWVRWKGLRWFGKKAASVN